MLSINARIEGKQRVSGLFQKVDKRLSNLNEPLKNSNDYMRDEIDKNFAKEGRVFGNRWKRLNSKYSAVKRRRYGKTKILEATGKMKDSFKSKFFRNKVVITNPTPYFKYHQSNKPRQKMPRRVMMEITRTQQTEIYRIFTKYLHKSVNG